MRLVQTASVKSLPVKRLSHCGMAGIYTTEHLGKFYLILCDGPRVLSADGNPVKVFEFDSLNERSNYLVRYITEGLPSAVGI